MATRWVHALRFSPDRGMNHSCSGRCLRSRASHRAPWMRLWSLCMRCLLKGTMAPSPGVNVGLSLTCHIPPSVLLAYSLLEPRFLGEHALDVAEGLTVRMQRVHVEMHESFSFCRHFRRCFFLGQPPRYGGERAWRALSCQYHWVAGEDCLSPSSWSSRQIPFRPWVVSSCGRG